MVQDQPLKGAQLWTQTSRYRRLDRQTSQWGVPHQ